MSSVVCSNSSSDLLFFLLEELILISCKWKILRTSAFRHCLSDSQGLKQPPRLLS